MLNIPFCKQFIRSRLFRVPDLNKEVSIDRSLVGTPTILKIKSDLLTDDYPADRVITQSCGTDLRKFYRVDKNCYKKFRWLKKLDDKFCPDGYQVLILMFGQLSPCEKSIGSGEGWHRDSWFDQFKALIYLSDVAQRGGQFEYVQGSSTLSYKLRDIFQGRGDRLIDDTKADHLQFFGSAGTAVLFDATGIHRGAPNYSCTREAVTLYYFPKTTIPSKIYSIFGV